LQRQPELAKILRCDPKSNGIVEGSVRVPTILDAIREQVSSETCVLFAPGCSINDNDRSGFDEALKVARVAEVVILVVGDKAGLTIDCTSGESRDRADLGLPGLQQELVEKIAALGKPTVVVLINGRPLAIPWIAENIPALVEAWLPGEEGGAAIANVLFGEANPGGKLPVTFPRAVGQIPIFYNHKPSGGTLALARRLRFAADHAALSGRSRLELHAIRVLQLASCAASSHRRRARNDQRGNQKHWHAGRRRSRAVVRPRRGCLRATTGEGIERIQADPSRARRIAHHRLRNAD